MVDSDAASIISQLRLRLRPGQLAAAAYGGIIHDDLRALWGCLLVGFTRECPIGRRKRRSYNVTRVSASSF
jgi:hypothetical protein